MFSCPPTIEVTTTHIYASIFATLNHPNDNFQSPPLPTVCTVFGCSQPTLTERLCPEQHNHCDPVSTWNQCCRPALNWCQSVTRSTTLLSIFKNCSTMKTFLAKQTCFCPNIHGDILICLVVFLLKKRFQWHSPLGNNDLHAKLACMSLCPGRVPAPEGNPYRQTCKAFVWAGSQIQEHAKAARLMTMSGVIRGGAWLTQGGTVQTPDKRKCI